MAKVTMADSKGQVERLARLYRKKFASAFGSSLDAEDLEQEFWIVWQRVSEKFDPERGQSFESLLAVSIKNHAINLAHFFGRRGGASTLSLDAENNEGFSMIDNLVGREDDPEEALINKERSQKMIEGMDPRLRQMVSWLMNPPEALVKELDALKARAEYGETLGVKMNAPDEVGLGMMVDLYGLGRHSRYRLLDQLKEVMADYDR